MWVPLGGGAPRCVPPCTHFVYGLYRGLGGIEHMGEHLGNKLLEGTIPRVIKKHGDHSPGGHGTRYHRALCRFTGEKAVGT